MSLLLLFAPASGGGSVTWNPTTGQHKSQYLTISAGDLAATGQGGFNDAPISVRATAPAMGKRQFQATSSNRTASNLHIGVDDGADNFNDTNWSRGNPGVSLETSGFGCIILKDGVSVQTPTGIVINNGDTLVCEFDTSAGTVSFYAHISGVTSQVGTTVTGVSMSAWYANVGLENSDTLTAKFGSGQVRPLSSGYSYYESGAAGYTLTADAGTYTLTGTAAGTRAQRRIVAAGGTYALAGTAAALRIARRIVAGGGTYSLTGTAAGLRAARAMPAAGGAYALTGTAANFAKGYRMVAAAGAYSLTGTAAGLATARRIVAAGGFYAISGTAANLRPD
jgi:hypothetical protein